MGSIILLRTPLVQWLLAAGPDDAEVDRWDELPEDAQKQVLRAVRRIDYMNRANSFTPAGAHAVDHVVAISETEIDV